MAKRFIVIYQGQAFPVRSKSAKKIKADILNAYVKQEGKEDVTFQRMNMVSTDIALGRYVIKSLDEWFDEETKKKGSMNAPPARSTV